MGLTSISLPFNGTIADLNLKSSQANERATKIESENVKLGIDLATQQGRAAQAELALLKLQQRLAWRTISPEEYERAKRELAPFKGSEIIIASQTTGDQEPVQFAKQVAQVFFDSHWKVKLLSVKSTYFLPPGIACDSNQTASGIAAGKFCARLPGVASKNKIPPDDPNSRVAQIIIRSRSQP